MLEMLRDLIAHKGHANAALLQAVRPNAAATADPELVELLHHVLLANRFWLLAVVDEPFDFEAESRKSDTFGELVERYAELQAREEAWLETATAAELGRVLRGPLIPNGQCTVAQALMQVCLHSHGHRAQAAKLLRRHRGTPPQTDFIVWIGSRPTPEWGPALGL